MHRLRRLWNRARASLWFVPSTCVLFAIVLALVLTAIDAVVGEDHFGKRSLLFGVGVDGARGTLTAIAGSMMTVASLTFSLTISTLATASSQYTSRLIRNFMRDRFNQFTLGYFVGLFAYCLVTLRTIRGGGEVPFVPSIAVFAALILAILSIGVLIGFIHHIASSIQASVILSRIVDETTRAIDHLFPAELGEPASRENADAPDAVLDPATAWVTVAADDVGFIESVDPEGLLDLAEEHGTAIRMTADVGDFVTPLSPLCDVACETPPDDDLADAIRARYSIGHARSIDQDPAFGIRQIVDIGLKALSPGVNDTTTGVMCVLNLGAILETLCRRKIPDELRAKDGTLRVIARGRSFEALVRLALDQFRVAAKGNLAVYRALAQALTVAARAADDARRRLAIERQSDLLNEAAERTLETQDERDAFRTSAFALRDALTPAALRRSDAALASA